MFQKSETEKVLLCHNPTNRKYEKKASKFQFIYRKRLKTSQKWKFIYVIWFKITFWI